MKFLNNTLSRFRESTSSVAPSTYYRLALSLVLFAIPTIIFVSIAEQVYEKSTIPLDVSVLMAVHSHTSSQLDSLVVMLTQLGGVVVISSVLAIVFGYLWWKKQYRSAVIVLAGVGGAMLLNTILKLIFQRDRPELWQRIVTENSFSFPSGHAMGSSALALSLIIIAWPTRWRYPVLVGGIIYAMIIAYTRMYLGVHYPSDIIAGWSMSLFWLLLVSAIVSRWQLKKK